MNAEQYNQYGSIALNYDNDEPQYNIFAEEEPVAEVVAEVAVAETKPKLTIKTKKLTKKQQREEEERADSKTGRTVAEVAADAGFAPKKPTKKQQEKKWYDGLTAAEIEAEFAERERRNYAEIVAPIVAPKKAVKEVSFAEPVVAEPVVAIPSDCELVDMGVIEKMIADAVAPLQQRIKAIEEREDNQPLAPKPTKEGRLGYYQVADGDEELRRLRSLNHDLRKEIDAKTKTNQRLQDQLDENPTEVNRLKEMNAALRKERDGARNGRKAAMEYAQKLQRLLEQNGIAYEAE
jgi:hypothetical protein